MDWDLQRSTTAQPETAGESVIPFARAKERCVDQFERAYLEHLMSEAGGNLSLAARLAHMDRKYLRALLKRHSLWEPGRRGPRRKHPRPVESP